MEPKLANIDGFHGIMIKDKINVNKLKYFQTNSITVPVFWTMSPCFLVNNLLRNIGNTRRHITEEYVLNTHKEAYHFCQLDTKFYPTSCCQRI